VDLTERLTNAASAAGILASALPDAVARGTHAFRDEPTNSQVQQWAASLRDVASHFFPQAPPAPGTEGVPPGVPVEVWRGLSPSSKLAWAREHGYGSKPVERRPRPLDVRPEQAQAFAQMTPHERLTAFRQMQQEKG
jgi:hypothetical protein